uniref:Uncharacterized protein n=1 Tax=Cairina moschata TaxID=8855 RepID=A0A8C3CV65_CAIMO
MCERSWEQFSHKWLGFVGTFFLRQGGERVIAQGTVRCGSLRWKCAERWFSSLSPRNNWVSWLLFLIASGTMRPPGATSGPSLSGWLCDCSGSS